jgi:hypothetical protein
MSLLFRPPEGWSEPVVAVVAMLVLAALDLGGSWAAKEAAERRSPGFAALGAGLFVLLFWVYASSLQVAELSAVTFGWIVLLQVGVVLLDRFRYGAVLTPGAWVAIAVLLAAQAYLLLAPVTRPTPAATGAGSRLSTSPIELPAENPAAQKPPAEAIPAPRADTPTRDPVA